MLKTEFLENPQTEMFASWLSKIINGSIDLEFKHTNGIDLKLECAKNRYAWPNKRTNISTPDGLLTLVKNSNLKDNEVVLNKIALGLQKCLDPSNLDEELIYEWMRAIMIWGGVYTATANGKGNAGWLESKKGRLVEYMQKTLFALNESKDDQTHNELSEFRSNAGTTKIHSLALPDFIIYDSRVAAALAWLVSKWALDSKIDLPEHLKFACMRANTSDVKLRPRSPSTDTFPYFSASGNIRNHQKHAMWNLRANWVLRKALDKCSGCDGGTPPPAFQSMRNLEAALFMVGENLGPELQRRR